MKKFRLLVMAMLAVAMSSCSEKLVQRDYHVCAFIWPSMVLIRLYTTGIGLTIIHILKAHLMTVS